MNEEWFPTPQLRFVQRQFNFPVLQQLWSSSTRLAWVEYEWRDVPTVENGDCDE